MKYQIELVTLKDVQKFSEIVRNVEGKVRLSGKDEHGAPWELSAKSILCVLLLGGHIQHINRAAQDIDWNAIYCESDKEIYSLIREFIKE